MLKQLIQRLLNSRTTPAEAAHASRGSFLSEGKIVIQLPDADGWTKLIDYVSPQDGYLAFKGIANNSSLTRIGIWSGDDVGTFVTSNIAGRTLSLLLPVSKGQAVTPFAENIKEARLTFFRAIGGYNLFIWRALSCLRALYNFSPRSFCKANPNGSATKQCLTIQQSGLSTRLKALRANTSLRVTGVSLFTLVAMNGRKSGMETGASLSPQRVLPTSAFKCLLPKVLKLGTSIRTPRLTELKKRTLSLPQQSERNVLTGGALC